MQAFRRDGEDLATVVRHTDHVLELRREAAVTGDGCPAIVKDFHVRAAGVDHRFNGEEHARLQYRAFAGAAEV